MKHSKVVILALYIFYCSSSSKQVEKEEKNQNTIKKSEKVALVESPTKNKPEKNTHKQRVKINIKEDRMEDVKDYNSAGMKYFSKRNYKTSLRYYIKHKEEQEKNGLIGTNAYATTLHNIGMVYSRLGKDDKALEHYTRSMAVMDSIGLQNTSDYATTLFNIGKLFYQNYKKPCEAVHWLERAVRLEEKLRHKDLTRDRKYYMKVDGECEY